MKSKILFIFLFIFLISLTFAKADLGTFAQNSCVDIKTILNATSVNISTVSYPNSSTALTEKIMNKSGYTFNYSFCDTGALGTYNYDYHDSLGNTYVNTFEVTYAGIQLSTSQSIIFLVAIAVLFFMFFITFFGIQMLPSENTKNPEGEIISISYLKYFRPVLWFVEWCLVIAILFISANLSFAYLGDQMFANILFLLFRICAGGTFIIIPVMFAYMLQKIVTDKKTQDMIKRGIYPQGNI